MIIEILVCWALGTSVFWRHIPWRVIQSEYSFIEDDEAIRRFQMYGYINCIVYPCKYCKLYCA